MQRLVKFSQFRNLGFDEDQYLLLNSDFKKGKAGNLIVLIGPNNSGKSNVLEGILAACGTYTISNRDVTDLSFEEKYKNPSLALVYKNDKYTFEYQKDKRNSPKWVLTNGNKTFDMPSRKIIEEGLESIYAICLNNNYHLNDEQLFLLVEKMHNFVFEDKDLFNNAMDVLRNLYTNYRNLRSSNYLPSFWDALKNAKIPLIDFYEKMFLGDDTAFVTKEFSKETGFENPIPKCIVYKESSLGNRNLFVNDVNDLGNNKFFVSLFKAIDVDLKTVLNSYSQFNQTGNIQCLRKLEKDLQKKIDKVADRFNKLYFASNDSYKFSLCFESNRISFGMGRGKEEEPITLDYQSTGFKWFFNLFFNFLMLDSVKPGDIVIMDEPAMNLHPQGQMELRNFIKNYAIKNDILFVIATHCPFLIDVDHYDELRVVSMENNRSKIQNKFTVVNPEDPDSLLPIKESLTIKQNVLYDLDTEVYFVEGITDYIYLTMFKDLLEVKNIAFLPFNGVGNNSALTKAILEKLIKIRFHKRSLLVDADKAGLDMFKQAQNADFDSVHNMSEVKITENKNAMMVEDLFSEEDKKKYSFIKTKHSSGASVMKDHCKLSDFSKQTIENFKNLFNILTD